MTLKFFKSKVRTKNYNENKYRHNGDVATMETKKLKKIRNSAIAFVILFCAALIFTIGIIFEVPFIVNFIEENYFDFTSEIISENWITNTYIGSGTFSGICLVIFSVLFAVYGKNKNNTTDEETDSTDDNESTTEESTNTMKTKKEKVKSTEETTSTTAETSESTEKVSKKELKKKAKAAKKEAEATTDEETTTETTTATTMSSVTKANIEKFYKNLKK